MVSANRMVQMLLYASQSTLICCVIVFIYCANRHQTKRIQPEDILAMLMLICLSGLRFEVGSDYTRYMQSTVFSQTRFSDLHVLFSKEVLRRYTYEIGYELLSVITGWFSDSPFAIFWIIALILYIPTVLIIRKKTSDAHAAFATFILFGFWGMSLNIMKQAIATLFTVSAYEVFKKQKYVLTIAFSMIAIAFHTTSIVAITLLVFVYIIGKKIYIPTHNNLRLMILVGIGLRFGTSLILFVMSRISGLSKYINYLNGQSTSINRSFIWIGVLIETTYICGILYYALGRLSQLRDRNPNIEEFLSILMIGIPFSIIGISRRLWLANRFANFFFIYLITVIPTVFGRHTPDIYGKKYIDKQSTRILFWCTMIGWHILYSVLMLDNNFFKISTYLFQ